ncbi:MAG: hypothetical protein ACMUHB_05390 [Thermoplasmatota archaeon]
MFDRRDIENLGAEFENGLKSVGNEFTEAQVMALRTAFEMAMVNTLRMIENRVELKKTEQIK